METTEAPRPRAAPRVGDREQSTGGDPAPSARLGRLRETLLSAPYSLCTQKAELLTRFFREVRPGHPLTRLLTPAHFSAMRKTLEQNLATGAPQPMWKLRVSRALQQLYMALEDDGPPIVLMAHGLGYTLDNLALKIHDDELIVGNLTSQRIGAPIHPDFGGMLLLPELDTLSERSINPMQTTPEQVSVLEDDTLRYWFHRSVMARGPALAQDPALQNTLMEGRLFLLTQFAGISHVTPDYPAVLEKGFVGLRDDVRAAAASAGPEQAPFYRAAEIVADAAIRFGARWAAHCRDEAHATTDAVRRTELERLAATFEQVPARPARSFYEAVQSVFLAHVIVHQESFQHGVSFGRLDQMLYPYFARDVAAGILTEDEAVEILGCFLGKAAEQLPLFNQMATEFFSGLSSASGITLGGVGPDGVDASNRLTELLLVAYDQLRLRQPNLHLRVSPDTPRGLLDRAFGLLKKGGGMPALFNDAAVVPALEGLPVSRADALNYAVVGCVEWGVPSRSFPAAGAGFISLPAVLMEAIGESAFVSAEAVFEAFSARLSEVVEAAVAGNNAIEQAHATGRPTPLLSLLVDGCVASGRDVTAGGAVYDSTGIQGVGVADVADSLAAIEQVVFEESVVDFSGLMAAVRSDFAGAEGLRQRLLNRVSHYGEDAGRAEGWAHRVAEVYCGQVSAHTNPRGGPYAPGLWAMTTHVGFGHRLGALPSGRKAGAPLSPGISPTSGLDRRGPTASMRAAAQAGGDFIANGTSLNETLDPHLVAGAAGDEIMAGLVRGYFAAGGMQVQFNVLDADTLRDAVAHPEQHRGLVVRVSGYSTYFNDLTDEMKDELIRRTQHCRLG